MSGLRGVISEPAGQAIPHLRAGLAYLMSRWRFWWVAALINVVLLAAFVWSHPGNTTTLRIEAIGGEFQAYIDGKLHARAAYTDYPTGGVGLQLPAEDAIPSIPGPAKLESVSVTDERSGKTLFGDSFDEKEDTPWVAREGEWIRRGAYWSSTGGSATTGHQPWRDYIVEARFSNLRHVAFFVRVQDNGDAVTFSLQRFSTTEFTTAFHLKRDGTFLEGVGGRRPETSMLQTVRSILGTALRPYPTLALLALGALVVVGVSALLSRDRALSSLGRRLFRPLMEPLAWGTAIAAFAILLYLNYVVADHMPHVPDSVAYVFQAKIFASFRLFATAPELAEHFSISIDNPISREGRWFIGWPFGHPMALAVGERLGAPWLIPPLLGALTVYLVYRVGSHIYGAGTGLLAAVLLLLSPFFQMTGSNFMSHNTAAFFLTGATFFFVRPTGRPALSWFICGVLLGLLFNTRPLTTAGVLLPVGLVLAYDLWRVEEKRPFLRRALALAIGFGLLLALYFLYNRILTGSFTTSPNTLIGNITSDTVGFSGQHTVAAGLLNVQSNLAVLVLVLNGWPLAIGLLFVLLPFILGTRNRWDYFFLGEAVCIALVWTAYYGVFFMHGPRFWYEMVPFLMLLSARGAMCLVNFVGDAASWLGERLKLEDGIEARATASLAVSALVVILLAYSVHGWMLGKHEAWPHIEFVPSKASELKDFNATNPGLLEEVERQDLHDALVLVKDCVHWWCYGSVFWKNSPDLDSDIVYARDLGPEKNATLIAGFPDRAVYLADYDKSSVETYVAAPYTPSPTPAPSPAPDDPTEISQRDSQRREDLKRIGEALEQYRLRSGTYPSTGGAVQSLCTYPKDAGCALLDVMLAIPQDPQDRSYGYASDGEKFSLFAVQEGGVVDPGLPSCPFYREELLDAGVGYCLSGPP